MATSTDPTFGAGFDPDEFRKNIRLVMNMGLPEAESERVTFRWKSTYDYTIEDPDGDPYDWSSTPIAQDEPEDVQVPAAVEFVSNRTEGGSPIGEFDNPRVILTLLDVDYELIKTANQVLLGGNTYTIRFWGPPVGLFSVTVYQAYLNAEDEA